MVEVSISIYVIPFGAGRRPSPIIKMTYLEMLPWQKRWAGLTFGPGKNNIPLAIMNSVRSPESRSFLKNRREKCGE
jgi:hypothetical protein